jgi:hypothetical protein
MFILLNNCIVLVNYFIIKGGLWSNLKEVIVFEEEKDADEEDNELKCYCGLCYSVYMIMGLFTRRLLINTQSVK